jgi:hypothetical protein
MAEEEDPLVTTRSTGGGPDASDPRDDWLGSSQGGDLDWFPDDKAPLAGGPARPGAPAGAPAAGADDHAHAIRRRREIAAVAIVGAVLVVVILAFVAFGGGSGSKTPPATTPTTTPTTTPSQTTTQHTGTTGNKGTTTTTTTSSTPTSLRLNLPAGEVLQLGSTGSDVVTLQKALILLGATSLTADGNFGPSTESAVKAFQTAHGIKADGVVGSQTAAAINTALAAL